MHIVSSDSVWWSHYGIYLFFYSKWNNTVFPPPLNLVIGQNFSKEHKKMMSIANEWTEQEEYCCLSVCEWVLISLFLSTRSCLCLFSHFKAFFCLRLWFYLCLFHPASSLTSVVISTAHLGLTFNLSLVRTEPTYNQPAQQWTFTSDFAVSVWAHRIKQMISMQSFNTD